MVCIPTLERGNEKRLNCKLLFEFIVRMPLFQIYIFLSFYALFWRPYLRNEDKLTSPTMYYSFRSSLPIQKYKKLEIAYYSCNFCTFRSNKPDLNLCACLGMLFRPRPLVISGNYNGFAPAFNVCYLEQVIYL